jgi:hypothetical protein
LIRAWALVVNAKNIEKTAKKEFFSIGRSQALGLDL